VPGGAKGKGHPGYGIEHPIGGMTSPRQLKDAALSFVTITVPVSMLGWTV
jgi:hypothetical protein